jgi:hypothetical protein
MAPKPSLIIDGENGWQYGLAVEAGWIVPVRRNKEQDCPNWESCESFPPKLAAHMELFITQHYHALDNQYGLPKKVNADGA